MKNSPTRLRIGEHGWNRTIDNLIKSQVLYRLSYVLSLKRSIKNFDKIEISKKKSAKFHIFCSQMSIEILKIPAFFIALDKRSCGCDRYALYDSTSSKCTGSLRYLSTGNR